MGDILKYILYFFLSLLELSDNSGFPDEDKKMDSYYYKRRAQIIFLSMKVLVEKYYALNNHHLLWFSLDRESIMRRKQFKSNLDSCRYIGLNKLKYHYQFILEHVNDLLFTRG